jgi:hypothetical protein
MIVSTTYEPWVIEIFHCDCGARFCYECEMLLFRHGYVHNAWWLYKTCPLCIFKFEKIKRIHHELILSIMYVPLVDQAESKSPIIISETTREKIRLDLRQEKELYEEEWRKKLFPLERKTSNVRKIKTILSH